MKRILYPLQFVTILLIASGCSEDDAGLDINKKNNASTLDIESIASMDDLPNCTSKRLGAVFFVDEEDGTYVCTGEEWEEVQHVVTDFDELPNCTKKKAKAKAFVIDDEEIYTCKNMAWSEPGEKDSGNDSSDSESDDPDSSPSEDDGSPKGEVTDNGFTLVTKIYDSDIDVNAAFFEAGSVDYCTGVKTGVVKTTIGSDRKPVFNEGNPNATVCAVSEEVFNTLFNYTKGKNEVVNYTLSLAKNADNYYVYYSDNDGDGGFFPIEDTDNESLDKSIDQSPCVSCREKHLAQGPVPYSRLTETEYEQYCNTVAWSDGIDCSGLFSDGDTPAIWDWGARRWEGLRNQYFCMEAHGSFKYTGKEEAFFSANGDLWVFVNGKLVVDLGGNHLAAPGYVPMENLNLPEQGRNYAIDMFYCQRKPTMSGFSIKTNFVISQK